MRHNHLAVFVYLHSANDFLSIHPTNFYQCYLIKVDYGVCHAKSLALLPPKTY